MRTETVIAEDARRRIPLYAAGLGSASVGIAALSTAVNDNQFTALVFGLLTLGFATSWGIRAGLVRRRLLERGILVVLGAVLLGIVMMRDLRYEFLPPSAFAGMDNAMASALAWLMVVYSFNLYTDKAVVFICVPSLSLIGLVGTFGPNTEILTYFVMFICFASFALVEQNALSAPRSGGSETSDIPYRMGLTAGIAVVALCIGLVIGQALLHSLGGRITSFFLDSGTLIGSESQVESDFMPVCTGPVALSNVEVLTVRSSEPLMWRGQVFDTYTGRGWTNTTWEWEPLPIENRRAVPGAAPGRASRALEGYTIKWDEQRFGKRTSVKRVPQTFRVINTELTIVFGAAEPEFIAFHRPRQIVLSGGALRTRRSYGPLEPYTVVSAVNTAGLKELAHAGDDYPEFIWDRYRRVPPACWQIERLTQQVVGDRSGPYDKAVAIRDFLESRYTYDTGAPAAPENEDAVTYFLLKSKRGYCDVFASALAIMCRQAGVPARVVSGFAAGEYDPEDDLYHVRQRDRHAWPEIYFPNYGWVTFDLAPQEAGPGALAGLWKALGAAYRAVTGGAPGTVTSILLIVLILYLLKVEVLDRFLRREHWGAGLAPNIGRAALNYRNMCDAFARLGYPRRPSTTPVEYAAQLAGAVPAQIERARRTVEAVTLDFLEARYALRDLSDGRMNETTSLLEEFTTAVRRLSRADRRAIRRKRSINAR